MMKGNKLCSVAIDGPGGAGKSSISKAVAALLGFVYVDTGAIYRSVGLAAYRAGLQSRDTEGVTALLDGLDLRLLYDEDSVQHMILNGEDVSGDIRAPIISRYASDVSAMPSVRAFLLEMQRRLARENHVIMDGRDIGTVVLPDAGLKIFLTASPEERALRRYRELCEKGVACEYAQVLEELGQRDQNDSTRADAPLRQAPDAVLVDTTELDFVQSLDVIVALIKKRFDL